jgi:hypothetical protein
MTLNLPALSDRGRERYATPKSAMTTRLDVKDAKDTDDEKRLDVWRATLRTRADGRCQRCGVKTIRTLALNTKRGEGHHIVKRAEKALRYDPRNGLHLCLRCHERITMGKLFVQQLAKHMFRLAGASHIDGSKPVTFQEAA